MLKAIKLLLFFLATLFLLVFLSLFVGVKISSFSLGNVSVSQFYIKLDKKLILTIENIILNDRKTKSESTFEELKNDLKLFPNILEYFEYIDIENLRFSDNRLTITLEDNYLYLDNKFINIATSFEHSSSNTKFDLYSLMLKDQDIILDGKIDVDYKNDKISYNGKFFLEDIIADLSINSTKEFVDFNASSNYFNNLHFLKPYLKDLGKEAKEWMYDNVKGPIKLDSFSAKYDISKNELVPDSLNGKAQIKDAQIKFHKDVEAIKTSSVDVTFINGNLLFILNNPTFKDIPMDGSSVKIENLIDEDKGKVIVNIKTNHRLDKKIQTILKAYDINIPLIQNNGITKANLILDIPYSYPMKTNGTFKISNSNISINDSFEFYSKSADVVLDGSLVKISNADFKHKDMIDANVDLVIDTDTLNAQGKAKIKSILIQSDDEEILNVKDTQSVLALDFNDEVNIDLLSLETFLKIDEFINIEVRNLSKLVEYSKLLKDNNVEYGNLDIKVKDFENLTFNGLVFGRNLQLYSKNELSNYNLKKLPLDGVIENSLLKLDFADVIFDNIDDKYDVLDAKVLIEDGNINFNANVQNLNIPLKKNNKFVENLNLNGQLTKDNLKINTNDDSIIYEVNFNSANEYAKVYLKNYDVLINTDEKEKTKTSKYKVHGENVNILINDKYKFMGKSIDAIIDENVVLNLKYGNSEVRFEDVNNINKVFAKNLTDTYLNTIFSKDIFFGGIMDLEIAGKNYELDGKINLNNSRIKDLAFINNLITFVNTSPALLNPLFAIPSLVDMLNNDGFNLNGYRINEGEVEFKYSPVNNKVLVKKLNTIGNSVDFEGNGIIDLKNDTLDMNMHLIFLKGYSNIVKHVPVVNYLLLGKNNRVDTNVKIVGPINDPEIETNFIKEGLNAPLDFGKRILNTPKNLIDSIVGEEEK